MGLGIVYTVLFLSMGILLSRMRARGRTNPGFAVMLFNDVMCALMNAIIAAWSWTALRQAPSELLVRGAAGTGVVIVVGSAVLGARQGLLELRAKRRAMRTQ